LSASSSLRLAAALTRLGGAQEARRAELLRLRLALRESRAAIDGLGQGADACLDALGLLRADSPRRSWPAPAGTTHERDLCPHRGPSLGMAPLEDRREDRLDALRLPRGRDGGRAPSPSSRRVGTPCAPPARGRRPATRPGPTAMPRRPRRGRCRTAHIGAWRVQHGERPGPPRRTTSTPRPWAGRPMGSIALRSESAGTAGMPKPRPRPRPSPGSPRRLSLRPAPGGARAAVRWRRAALGAGA
jgi:hypothetical protein